MGSKEHANFFGARPSESPLKNKFYNFLTEFVMGMGDWLWFIGLSIVVIGVVAAELGDIYRLYLVLNPPHTPYVHPNNMKVIVKDQ